MPSRQALRCSLLFSRQVSQRKIMVSRASSSSAQISSASISPLDCSIFSEISRMACRVSAALRLGFGFSSGFSSGFSGSLVCRSCWTRAGLSSGGALAMAAPPSLWPGRELRKYHCLEVPGGCLFNFQGPPASGLSTPLGGGPCCGYSVPEN